jgi:hypothetical protein
MWKHGPGEGPDRRGGAMSQMERFLEQALGAIPAPLHAWVPAQKLRRVIAGELERQLAWTQDPEFAARFARQCPVAGVPAEAYLHRLLELGSGHQVLAGVRFKGGDLGFPFVELLAADFAWTEAARLGEALEAVFGAFGAFKPLAARLLWDDGARLPAGPWGVVEDLCYVAAPVSRLQAAAPVAGSEALTLRLARDLEFYPRYEAAWGAFQGGGDPWRAEVMCTDPGDFEDCLRFGLVCEGWVGERWAGLFAARRLRERYFDGYVVQDMILGEEFRGRGLAAALQQGALRHLSGQRQELLYGTIHAQNAPSLATARRCGRQRLSTYVFLTPVGGRA